MSTVSLGVSICLDVISIETLNLDIWKNHVSTVAQFLTVQIPCLDSLDYSKILLYLNFCQSLYQDLDLDSLKKDILTLSKVDLDRLRNLDLDLDWSRQSRPPGLVNWHNLISHDFSNHHPNLRHFCQPWICKLKTTNIRYI